MQLSQRLEEVFLNGKWIANTNFKIALDDVHFEQATTLHGNHNSIAALTFHINYYLDGLLNVFKGGPLEIRDKYSFDMPSLNTEKEWTDLKNVLYNNATLFSTYVKGCSDDQLHMVFVKEEYGTYRRNIERIIEHAFYHLGQILLLKKIILTT